MTSLSAQIFHFARERACCRQWRNGAPGAPATPGGATGRGRQIVAQMWDNFARLTARLAKMRVFFNNFAIFRDFSVIFSDFVPDSYPSQGRPLGAPFLAEGRQIGEGFNVTPLV